MIMKQFILLTDKFISSRCHTAALSVTLLSLSLSVIGQINGKELPNSKAISIESTGSVLSSILSLPPSFYQEDEFFHEVFPSSFQWGVGTSAFQVEGAWNKDGKGESIWDRFCHDKPDRIADKSNGTISCDFYDKYKDDVKLVKYLGANIFRFSLSWSRILPKGTSEVVNQEGIKFYNNLINELISQGIEPMICLFHWDVPQNLQENGGWLNKNTINLFGEFARLAYESFGDRVKKWITINEPFTFCIYGYDKGTFAPGLNGDPANEPYQCVHSLILAHSLAYRIYKEGLHNGSVGISLDNFWQQPADPNSDEDQRAAEQSYIFRFDWIAYPLFKGEYPPLMRKIIDDKSKQEKMNGSRLPSFDAEWVKRVNGSLDFLGINHFTTQLVQFSNNGSIGWESDSGTIRSYDPNWPSTGSKWLKIVPQGIRKALQRIKMDYNNPQVIITENGVSDNVEFGGSGIKDGIKDTQRIFYHRSYINEVLKAIHIDGCNVTGYLVWSLLDAFEWNQGYTEKFGIIHVNFSDPQLIRRPKQSALALKQIFKDNGFPDGNFKISVIQGTINNIVDSKNKSGYSPRTKTVIYAAPPIIVILSAYFAYNHI